MSWITGIILNGWCRSNSHSSLHLLSMLIRVPPQPAARLTPKALLHSLIGQNQKFTSQSNAPRFKRTAPPRPQYGRLVSISNTHFSLVAFPLFPSPATFCGGNIRSPPPPPPSHRSVPSIPSPPPTPCPRLPLRVALEPPRGVRDLLKATLALLPPAAAPTAGADYPEDLQRRILMLVSFVGGPTQSLIGCH